MSPVIWKKVSDTLVQDTRSGMFYARQSEKGRGRFFQTTGLRKKTEAQRKANEMLAQWRTGQLAQTLNARTVREVIEVLRDNLEREMMSGDRARKTWDSSDRPNLNQVEKHFGDEYVAEIDEIFWKDWIQTVGKGLGRTLGDIAKYLSMVLTYAHQNKLISRKPAIHNPDPAKEPPVPLTMDQIETLLEKANPVIADLIILAAECGLRPYESRRLQWEMIDFPRDCVLIKLPAAFTKTRRARELEAGPETSKMLRRRCRAKRSPYVFPSILEPSRPINEVWFSKKWRAAVKAAGLPKGTKFHWLRHTFFSQALLEANLPLPMVAAYGGNSPKILFDRYLAKDAGRTRKVAGAVKLRGKS